MQDIATAMQRRADLIEKLNAADHRPQMTAALSTAQLEQLARWEDSRESVSV
jgi:hypothetical protein